MSTLHDLKLAATDGYHDFNFVTVGKRMLAMAAARHDFAIAFERYALARESQRLDQACAIERVLILARFAINGQGYHGKIIGRYTAGHASLESFPQSRNGYFTGFARDHTRFPIALGKCMISC